MIDDKNNENRSNACISRIGKGVSKMFVQLRLGDADDCSAVMQSHAAALQRSQLLNPSREQ